MGTAQPLAQRTGNTGVVGADRGVGDDNTLTSRGVDARLYKSAAGGLAFNVTTVRMESEFDENNAQNEIQIVYDYYAPSDTENTTYDLRLYNKDCVTHGTDSNVGSEYITVAQADPLYKRNAQAAADISAKEHSEQVHLAGLGWSNQVRLDIPLDVHQDKIFDSPYFELGLGYDDESSTHAVMSVIAISFASIFSI